MFFPTKLMNGSGKEQDMMTGGMLGSAGLWDMPDRGIFRAVTCRIPHMISTGRGSVHNKSWLTQVK